MYEDQDPLEVADHEAGHFTMACILGWNFTCDSVTIERIEGAEGTVSLQVEDDPPLGEVGLYAMAGIAAQALGKYRRQTRPFEFGGAFPVPRETILEMLAMGCLDAAEHDRVLLGRHPDYDPKKSDFEFLLPAIQRLEEHLLAVEELAQALLEQGNLSGDEAWRIVSRWL